MNPCIACGAKEIEQFFNLGLTGLANKFLTKEELTSEELQYPLVVGYCHSCGHVQLDQRVPPPLMFEDYLYVSSASITLTEHLRSLAEVSKRRGLFASGELVVDIGSNDGTLLSAFLEFGARVLGVDPARNLVDLAEKKGVKTHTGFFGERTARELFGKYGQASLITATNVFPHIPDLTDFIKGLEVLLAPKGTFVIEAHYLADMLEQVAFDTIYHEHVSYWALTPMVRLFDRFHFEVSDVQRLPIHHGQLRVFVSRKGVKPQSHNVQKILESEKSAGIPGVESCRKFASAAFRARDDLHKWISNTRLKNEQIIGYGAPAKGSTLLSFLGLGPADIPYIVDKSSLKQNRYTPVTHIPIVHPDTILQQMPNFLLVLAWNFIDEIRIQQKEYCKRGGRLVLPVPELKILN